MSLQGYVHQLRPRKESYVNHVDKIKRYISEEMTPEAEVQRAIELVELIDTKVATIDAQTQLKETNKNRIVTGCER